MALSPLLSTALLLGISIALGALAMSWGKEYISEHATFAVEKEEVPSCIGLSFSVLSSAGTPQPCWQPEKLAFVIDNGLVQISDVHVRLLGRAGIANYEGLLRKPLGRAQGVRLELSYFGIGEPVQLKITPKIATNGWIYCTEQAKLVDLVPC